MADNEAIRVKLQSVLNEFSAFLSAVDVMRSLADAGLHLVTNRANEVLEQASKVRLGYASGDERYPFIGDGGFELAVAIHALQKEGKP